MSIMQKIMETVVQFMPDPEPDLLIRHKHGYIGRPFSRVDGQLKVKGEAPFAAEYKLENIAYAALVHSTIAKGKITKIDRSEAEKSSGVIAVITYENAPKMNDPTVAVPSSTKDGAMASGIPVLRDEKIYWNGQPVAIVVAETQDQADHAAFLIKVEYEEETARLSFEKAKAAAKPPKDIYGEPPQVKSGDAEDALKNSDVSVDNIYRTPRHNHNAIEPHATIAWWNEDGDGLTAFETTQNLHGVKTTLVEIFDLAEDKVRVLAPFVGGSFGGKGYLWHGTILCVAAARVVKRPVKLALSREGIFRGIGGRTPSEQRVAVGAMHDGKIVSLIHSGISATTEYSALQAEQISEAARHLYQMENYNIGQEIVNLDMVSNTFMRAPGDSIGTFALESAMDELAYELNIDPIEFRRINEPEKDPTKGTEFSMRNLTLAYQSGAKEFGWQWNPEPRSQKDGKWLVGQGVATAYLAHYRMPATARVRINRDGTALVQTAAHEMGMGTATVQIQHAADRLGLPINQVAFEYGDSDLPNASYAAAAWQTVTILAAVIAAIEKAHRELLALAGDDYDSPLSELKYDEIEARSGGLFSKKDASEGETYQAILGRVGQEYVEAEATSGQALEVTKYSMHSYGAQFAEVRVHEDTGEVRVSRFLGSFDCGKILNPKTATSQFRGGIIFGIGAALTEETFFDERNGRITNASLAEYHVPVNLDVPKIEIIYNDLPDEHTPLGAHGVGEIGNTGVAAAIANAVFNATGKRVRELPITLDKLL